MDLTRREFAALSGAAVALTVLGCDSHAEQPTTAPAGSGPVAGDEKKKKKIHLATEPFTIGGRSDYKQPVVSSKFHDDKGVFILSDGKTLVALSAMCPHRNCATDYEQDKKRFLCPCHKSTFDQDGNRLSGKADRPLERCAVRLIKDAQGKEEIEVDPRKRYRKDKDEWGAEDASLSLG